MSKNVIRKQGSPCRSIAVSGADSASQPVSVSLEDGWSHQAALNDWEDEGGPVRRTSILIDPPQSRSCSGERQAIMHDKTLPAAPGEEKRERANGLSFREWLIGQIASGIVGLEQRGDLNVAAENTVELADAIIRRMDCRTVQQPRFSDSGRDF
jgi:hypothetical protein